MGNWGVWHVGNHNQLSAKNYMLLHLKVIMICGTPNMEFFFLFFAGKVMKVFSFGSEIAIKLIKS
jgi:hypothetical protein